MNTLTGPKSILISNIKTAFFVREVLDQDRVLFFAGLYEADAKVPPVILNANHEMIDGRHRLEALKFLDRQEVKALISSSTNRRENILEAIRANYGVAMPPSQEDLRHSIELLINEGMKVSEIAASLPLPPSMTKRFIDDLKRRAYNRRIGFAMDAITDGMTVAKAAEKFSIEVDAIKLAIGQRKTRSTATIGQVSKGIQERMRAYGGFIGQSYRRILRGIGDNTYTSGDMAEFLAKVRTNALRSMRLSEELKERFSQSKDMEATED